ncbi:hypothetical protein PG987_013675 [Apiospora arundinis]
MGITNFKWLFGYGSSTPAQPAESDPLLVDSDGATDDENSIRIVSDEAPAVAVHPPLLYPDTQ